MRVIAGDYGGRPLQAVPGKNTRPTTDKVKEAMFQMLGPYFDGGLVLDLYAGSGALAIEAVSRGMDRAILVDKNRQAIKTIRENIKITKEEDKFELWQLASSQAIKKLVGKEAGIDLLILDPPYKKENILDTILDLLKLDLINDGTMILCETDKAVRLPENIHFYTKTKEKIYGSTNVTIYEKEV